jgi:hypothetical protein
MNPHTGPDAGSPNTPRCQSSDNEIAQLVSQVYETAPAVERRRLLEHLMQPLGLLSLVAVANGVFAKIWFRRDWQDLQVRLEDTEIVRASDVAALVNYVEQVSIETVDGLAQMLGSSSAMAGSAVAAFLVIALIRRARFRRLAAARDYDPSVPES